MYNFKAFLEELAESSNINFNLKDVKGKILYENPNNKIDESSCVNFPVNIFKDKFILILEKKYEVCASLLKYTIESRYREFFFAKNKLLSDIIEGKEISSKEEEDSLPFLTSGAYMMIIDVDGSKYDTLGIISEIYKDEDIFVSLYHDYIILIGNFENVEEHVQSIKEAITSDLYCKCHIAFSKPFCSKDDIKDVYLKTKESLVIGRRYILREDVFSYNKTLFVKIVHNLSSEMKDELKNDFKDIFNSFDSDMISTIEEFTDCDLNISDAAKKLYIHRNTLIYRLDKIYKESGFDIRKFKEAAVFIIAFLVWKNE